MDVIKAAFQFLVGWLAVVMVMMGIVMLLYIANVTIEELFHINVADLVIRRFHADGK